MAGVTGRQRRQGAGSARKVVGNVAFFALVAALLALFMFVFVWMVMTSLKQPRDVAVFPPVWVFQPTFDNYVEVFTKTPFFRQLRNSSIVATGAVLFGLVLGLPAAYAMARFRMRRLALTVLVVRMVPGMAFLLPLFVLYRQLGLINTHAGLILSHLVLVLPLTIWIMMGFFEEVPRELEEQARIDGCSRFGAFLRVSLPLATPGITVTAILAFIASWNNFPFVLILGGSRTSTLPMAVFNFMGFEQLNFGGVAAVASLLSLPIMVFTIIVQRWLVQGLTLGSGK